MTIRSIEATGEVLDKADYLISERGRRHAERYLRMKKLIQPGEVIYEISYRVGEDGELEGYPTMLKVAMLD